MIVVKAHICLKVTLSSIYHRAVPLQQASLLYICKIDEVWLIKHETAVVHLVVPYRGAGGESVNQSVCRGRLDTCGMANEPLDRLR